MFVTLNHVLEDVSANMHVHCGQGVVHDVDGGVSIHRARNGNALLLAATEVDALLPNLRCVPRWQDLRMVQVENGAGLLSAA